MTRKSWWHRFRDRRRIKRSRAQVGSTRPLREFVYLDEVSLTSLLVSQRDTIPEHVTSGSSRSEEAEISATASIDAVAAKAESAARYQTANSNSVESSRKAVVQTLFNEFRDDAQLPIVLQEDEPGPDHLPSVGVIEDEELRGWRGNGLLRGQLLELEVVLEVDPVFKLATMTSELSAMAAEYPQIAGPSGLAMLSEMDPLRKVLDRLLAGLIPIRARARNFSVAEIDGTDYVVHSTTAQTLGIPTIPLEVVGVTEHIGYWKDIRRLLFSAVQVRVLCRVARSGLHETWTPVKVADLFSDVAPALVSQIDAIGIVGVSGSTAPSVERSSNSLLRTLAVYATEIASATGSEISPQIMIELFTIFERLSDASSPIGQRRAFAEVRELVASAGNTLTASQDLEIRRRAREQTGLPVLPQGEAARRSIESNLPDVSPGSNSARLVDVEVVAIYW